MRIERFREDKNQKLVKLVYTELYHLALQIENLTATTKYIRNLIEDRYTPQPKKNRSISFCGIRIIFTSNKNESGRSPADSFDDIYTEIAM